MCNCKFSVKICGRGEERHKKTTQLKCGGGKINQNNNNKIGKPGFFRVIVLSEKPSMDEKPGKHVICEKGKRIFSESSGLVRATPGQKVIRKQFRFPFCSVFPRVIAND